MPEVVIEVKELSKQFSIGSKTGISLRETLVNTWNIFLRRKNNRIENFLALKDISFNVLQGEVLGIIGKNGAGKSTLLKVLSRITEPTSGKAVITGRVSSLLEVGTGFHPELTGRENIFLNGTILGMTRKEVKIKFDEIVDFSGIEKFIDTPVKHYSSGMYVRLAFAVAAHLEPEILIIDEVLAVGDAEFQKKCLGKMHDVASQGRTVLFVSHNLAAVQNLCTRGILLENGMIKTLGNVTDVISSYSAVEVRYSSEIFFDGSTKRSGNGKITFDWVKVLDDSNNLRKEFSIGDNIRIRFSIFNKGTEKQSELSLQIRTTDGMPVFHLLGRDSNFKIKHFTEHEIYSVLLEDIRLFPGIYSVTIMSSSTDGHEIFDIIEECLQFVIIDGGKYTSRSLPRAAGLFYLIPKWTLEK